MFKYQLEGAQITKNNLSGRIAQLTSDLETSNVLTAKHLADNKEAYEHAAKLSSELDALRSVHDHLLEKNTKISLEASGWVAAYHNLHNEHQLLLATLAKEEEHNSVTIKADDLVHVTVPDSVEDMGDAEAGPTVFFFADSRQVNSDRVFRLFVAGQTFNLKSHPRRFQAQAVQI